MKFFLVDMKETKWEFRKPSQILKWNEVLNNPSKNNYVDEFSLYCKNLILIYFNLLSEMQKNNNYDFFTNTILDSFF
jgi:hypothetical protein